MPGMTDPMDALRSLQRAVDSRIVRLSRCELHADLHVISDEAGGNPRITYANVRGGEVVAIAIFVITEPVHGVPCFQLGYAVVESMRSQGLASDIVVKGMRELLNGLKRNGATQFYVEAVIAADNEHSNKLAKRFLSDTPQETKDSVSGESALQYLKLLVA